MKTAEEFIAADEAPEYFEAFTVRGRVVVTVPDSIVRCYGCIKNTDPELDRVEHACHSLPPCINRTFISKEEFDSDEFKVRMVIWRIEGSNES